MNLNYFQFIIVVIIFGEVLMPPEPLPFDRKDFIKERKHERSVAASEFSSSSSPSLGPGPGLGRWRDFSPTSSSGYYGNGSRDFSRWGSSNDFRSRPPGHGKQGSWHLFEGSGYGYASPRSGEKIVGEDNFQAQVDGKYGRSCRENKSSFNQRDWKGNSLDTSNEASRTPGRQSDPSKCQPSVDDSFIHGAANCPHPDSVNSLDQLQLKDHDNNGKAGGANGLASVQRDNLLEWKPLNKWNRSGSLSSRGSGFSHSSSSKSVGGVDLADGMTELPQTNAASVHSPSGDVAVYLTSMVPSEEMTSRKKQRLGWGEGLAKYEKKKVEGPDMACVKDGAFLSYSNGDYNHSQCSNLPERSPRLLGFSDCASPATPSSVACSSSPGVEEKASGKAANMDNDVSNLCGSPTSGYQSHLGGLPFNLEKLDISSTANLGGFITSLLQYFDLNSLDSGFLRSAVINKLLVMKSDVSKSLEMTECEIDALENELKSLKFEVRSGFPSPVVSSSVLGVGNTEPLKAPGPSPLLVVLCEKDVVQKVPIGSGALEGVHGSVEANDVNSPGITTSKLDEPGSFSATALESETVKNCEHYGAVGAAVPKGGEQKSAVEACDCAMEACKWSNVPDQVNSCTPTSDSAISISDCEDDLCNLILASNKESASGAVEVLARLLPVGCCQNDFSGLPKVSFQQTNALIMEKFVARKRFLRFKEKVLSIKFKVFHQLWKEDLRMFYLGKFRVKPQKKCESSLRTSHNVNQKHRPSIRLRLNYPAGIFSLVPTSEMLNFSSKLLADSQVQPHRAALKMPALILDRKEVAASRYICSNGLVEDPYAVESEKAVVNPWSLEEREIFIDKLAMFGKDFQKIASFLDHKTTADCVVFYYKNHKSDCFARIKKSKQAKLDTDFMVAGSKRWNPEANAASLGGLGAASVIAADADNATRSRLSFSGRILLGSRTNSRTSQGDNQTLKRKNIDIGSEREAVAADVLAGICGSLSSEAMSSCVTTTADFGEGYWKRTCQNVDTVMKQCPTSEFTQNDDEDTCSDESSGDLDPSEWTDEEKSVFIQAVTTYGKDFLMIAHCVGTRSRDQCKVFFSKARKCLGLDLIHPVPGNLGTPRCDDADGGGSDVECISAPENSSNISSDKLGTIVDPDLQPGAGTEHDQSGAVARINIATDLNGPADDTVMGFLEKEASEGAEKVVSNAGQSEQKIPVLGYGDQNIKTNDIKQSESLIVHRFPLQTVDAESGNNQVFEDGSCAAESMAVEKPCRNGDVKLFGQILSNASSMQNTDTNNNNAVDANRAHNSVLRSDTPLRFTGHCGTGESVSQAKFDHRNQLGLENNHNMWCGTGVQSAYSSLADVGILHSEYPPLSSHHASSSKQAAVISNNLNLEGIFAFHPREMSSSSGLIDSRAYRSHDGVDGVNAHPFAIEMKQHQDTVSERPRNGLEVNPQQHSLGMEGMIGRGGILVGAPCTGVTDAVVAIRRQYAKNGQYSGQSGSIFWEEGSWRGKGDIDR